MSAAARIARDVDAILADGELDRAAYSYDDLRAAAIDSASSEIAREVARLGDAFAREQLAPAQSATRRLVALLASR